MAEFCFTLNFTSSVKKGCLLSPYVLPRLGSLQILPVEQELQALRSGKRVFKHMA